MSESIILILWREMQKTDQTEFLWSQCATIHLVLMTLVCGVRHHRLIAQKMFNTSNQQYPTLEMVGEFFNWGFQTLLKS